MLISYVKLDHALYLINYGTSINKLCAFVKNPALHYHCCSPRLWDEASGTERGNAPRIALA